MVKLFRDVPRWPLLAALVYAPWDYGATTERGIVTLNWILGVALGLWIIYLFGRGLSLTNLRWRRKIIDRGEAITANHVLDGSLQIPRVLLLVVGLLMALGWWMVGNAHAIYDSEVSMFVHVPNLFAHAPGSVDQAVSAAWMLRATTLLGALYLVADLCRDPIWLMRLWATLAGVGSSIALLGLIEKASGAAMIFWRTAEHPVTTFFGTFYYHGNAGAFLNLTLPLTVGLGLRSLRRHGQPVVRALWLALSIISVVAVFSNTSRMGQVLGAVTIVVLFLWLVPKTFARAKSVQWKTALIGILVAGVAIAGVIQASRLDRSLKRWERITETVPQDARWLAAKGALQAVPDAGPLGFGPGTFHVVFPYFTAGLGDRFRGFWHFLHQDYLQTVLEWGWLGSVLWAGLFFGAIAVGIRNRLNRQIATLWIPRQRLFLPLVLFGLCVVALHALVDFPLQIASIQLYVATYLGVCWGSCAWGRAEGRRQRPEVSE